MPLENYERVRAGGKTFLLRVMGENDGMLWGIEVNREGDEVIPRGADERLHLIDLLAITKRIPMTMNPHYGELEEVR